MLTADLDLLRQAARKMLIGVLSCRENRSQSGPFARIAGEAIGASLRLPNMATEEFLSCLSRGALETVARAEGVNIAPRAKDTRARMVTRFKDGTFVYPGALFRLTPEEQEAAAERRAQPGAGWVSPVTGDDGEGGDDGTSRKPATKTQPASTTTIRRNAKPPDPTSSACPGRRAGAGALYPEDTVMTHLSSDGGAMSPPTQYDRIQPPGCCDHCRSLRRRARLAELETEMIAACEAAALGTRSRIHAASRQRALGPGDLAPLPRRGDAAGGDLRPPHAPSSPGNRPARTADDLADRRLISTTTRFALRAGPCLFGAMGLAAIIHGATRTATAASRARPSAPACSPPRWPCSPLLSWPPPKEAIAAYANVTGETWKPL